VSSLAEENFDPGYTNIRVMVVVTSSPGAAGCVNRKASRVSTKGSRTGKSKEARANPPRMSCV
jgi:hypothetical protein